MARRVPGPGTHGIAMCICNMNGLPIIWNVLLGIITVSFSGTLFIPRTFSDIENLILPTLGYVLVYFYKVSNMP